MKTFLMRYLDFWGDYRRPWVGKIPWRRKWQPTPVSCLGIPWREEPGRLHSTGSQRVGHDWATSLSLSHRRYFLNIGKGNLLNHARLFVTLMGCNLPGFSVQLRVLEWVVISFSRGFSQPRDQTQVSRIARGRFNIWATREDLLRSSRRNA